MSSQGPFSPFISSSSDAGLGSAIVWSNASNNQISDDLYATAQCNIVNGDFSEYLTATSCGFTVPVNSQINGISVDIERKSNGSIVDNSVKIIKGGIISGSNMAMAGTWPGADTYQTYGNQTFLWGLNWTYADINSSNFGAAISATRNGGAAPTASVDHMRFTVYFTDVIGTKLTI